MATILKNSKIKINGEEHKWVAFPNALFNSTADDLPNVWGYNKDGELWFQVERGKELDEPYLNEWWYKVTIDECTDKNRNYPLNAWKWIYRCIKEAYEVTQRTIIYNGNAYRFSPLADKTSGDGMLLIPSFTSVDQVMMERVLKDITPIMTYGYEINHQTAGHAHYFTCPTDKKEMERRQARVTASVTEIDKIIGDLYKDANGNAFSPENKPKTVDDKVKVAKVIYDWLMINNMYTSDNEWEEQSIYAALSKGEKTPVCASYAYAARHLLSRYGIANLYCTGDRFADRGSAHAWVMVNYHAEYGKYPDKDDEWCVFDPTGFDGVLGKVVWDYFNRTPTDGGYALSTQKYPCRNPSDGDHKYRGKNKYGWDVDYELKESEE